jgi:hypothetical protein
MFPWNLGVFFPLANPQHLLPLPSEGAWELLSERRNLEFSGVHLWIPIGKPLTAPKQGLVISLQFHLTALAEGALGLLVPQTL